ncbi:UBN2 domain-containing protein [Cucumis melo var. makuwa]|uniref:UBN2 domain-containing protein n=1 Tax=Cucumis melo var. makuwa TaxID=1194695 RepID=A0A5D3CL10_CUCMM|nr:UBN2 domain-containing protein [Cucumis melo var. makuwa]
MNLVEQGYADPDDEGKLRMNKKKDSKVLVIIQQAVHDSVFSQIVIATTSKQAWLILQKEFQGDSRVLVVKLQSLRRDFETLMMKNGESIADFLSRATTIISQMQTYSETIKDHTIVEKVLRSLTPKFDHVVATIEESKDLSTFTFIELMGSLQAHESRINRSMERNEEKAFQVKDVVLKYNDSDRVTTRGRGRGGYRGRGCGIEKGCNQNEEQRQFGVQSSNKANIQCYHFKKFGHVKADCWYKNQRANSQQRMEHQRIMERVELGNGKELQVEGKGTVGIETHHGNRILTMFKSKSETFEKFKHFKAKVEKQSGMFIKSLRSDRGGEFLSNNFNHFCEEHGIHRELTTPYTPEQNGVVERKN